MKIINKTTLKIKNHFERQKVAYAMTAVAALAIALQQSNRKEFYKFLNSKGIDPMEYYMPEYFEELQKAVAP